MTSLQETYKWSALMDHFIICEEERVKTEVLVFPVAANGQHQLIDLKMLESDVRDIENQVYASQDSKDLGRPTILNVK